MTPCSVKWLTIRLTDSRRESNSNPQSRRAGSVAGIELTGLIYCK